MPSSSVDLTDPSQETPGVLFGTTIGFNVLLLRRRESDSRTSGISKRLFDGQKDSFGAFRGLGTSVAEILKSMNKSSTGCGRFVGVLSSIVPWKSLTQKY
ncbi:unnamed protein product [Orchesella dallaii]|uniref:Uncharacterized protein n=1 Tax=Orchesella dallaii TaxID=48710 RepID=A0ABP1Q1C6_9HEXA